MGKKLPTTPKSRVRNALRQLFLRSRERAAALKSAGNCCARCGVKASKAKGKEISCEVHHRQGVLNWSKIIDAVFEQLLCKPELLEVLCKDCHKQCHEEKQEREQNP